jgi:hypothetical protein
MSVELQQAAQPGDDCHGAKQVDHAPVMFTGMPRSGTTMLCQFAREYLRVAAVNEGTFEPWLARQNRKERQWRNSHALRRFCERFASHYYFTCLYKGPPPRERIVERLIELAALPSVQSLGRAALTIACEVLGLPRPGHEGPDLMRDPRAVLRVYPNARFVHIVRDPRDAATSILKKPWGANNAVVYGMRWAKRVTALRNFANPLGPERYFEFRYEDILQAPEPTMRRLMHFVLGEVDERGLDQFVAYMNANPRRTNFAKWKSEIPPRQAALLEAIAAEPMQHFGYELANKVPGRWFPEMLFWTSHHRAVQTLRILTGRLRVNGAAKYLRKSK